LRKGKTDRVLLEITNDPKRAHDWNCSLEEVVPLYIHPPKQWQGLTDEEIYEAEGFAQISHHRHKFSVRGQTLSAADDFSWHFAHAIEAKLREKNT
jgi:hypothetical protein